MDKAQDMKKASPATQLVNDPKVQPSGGAQSYGAVEEPSYPKAHPDRLRQWKLNMLMINFVEFSAESSRGIVMATLFMYLVKLGGDMTYMGVLTSVFSVGRFLSSMVFGWLSDRYSFKHVYVWSSAICFFGNLLYILADPHIFDSKLLLAFSRFIVGFGAGNRSVCRANVAHITKVSQRLSYIAILAMVVFLVMVSPQSSVPLCLN